MALSDNDINIKIKYTTEGEEEAEKAKKTTEDLGKKTKSQKDDFEALNLVNKLNVSSMKSLGASATSLASKLGVAGIAFGTTYKLIGTAVSVVKNLTNDNDRLRSSYSTLTTTINTQSGTLQTSEQVQKDVKDVSDKLGISQSKVNTALTNGVTKTHNYDLSMRAVKDAYDLASQGVGDFETNYNNLIDAYTGDLSVWDEETGTRLQAGTQAYDAYYRQAQKGSDETLGVANRNNELFLKTIEDMKTGAGKKLDSLKQSAIQYVNEIFLAWQNKDWNELINLTIIDPLNMALRALATLLETWQGLPAINRLFGTHLNFDALRDSAQIPRLTSTQYVEPTASPEGVYMPSNGTGMFGVNPANTAPTVNVQVEGSVWTTRDLASELSGIMFEELKLRGAR